jgi:hypothetical protein
MMLTASSMSTLPSATAFADIASIAVAQDQTLDKAERRVRALLRAQQRWASRSEAAFMREIERMIGLERQGKLALTEEELTTLIDEWHLGESDLRTLLRSFVRAFHRLEGVAARDGEGRRDLVRLTGREFIRIMSDHIAAYEEGRWMLIGIRDGREPRQGGRIVTAPEQLRQLLTVS